MKSACQWTLQALEQFKVPERIAEEATHYPVSQDFVGQVQLDAAKAGMRLAEMLIIKRKLEIAKGSTDSTSFFEAVSAVRDNLKLEDLK